MSFNSNQVTCFPAAVQVYMFRFTQLTGNATAGGINLTVSGTLTHLIQAVLCLDQMAAYLEWASAIAGAFSAAKMIYLLMAEIEKIFLPLMDPSFPGWW